jgi:transcription elongation factor Elf1
MNYIDSKYVRLVGSQLERFKEKSKDLFNCKCPLCGDSKKKKSKCRGYIYSKENKAFYRCFNCGASMSISTFIQTINNDLFLSYLLEKFRDNKIEVIKAPELVLEKTPEQKLFETGHILKYCHKLSGNIPEDMYEIYDYANNRKIPLASFEYLYAGSDLNLIARNFDKYSELKFPVFPILVIPFFDENGGCDYIQCRHINKNEGKNDRRFTTFEVNENSLKIYGVDRIDWNKTVRIVEGPIDSLFVDNCLGMAGISQELLISYIKKMAKKEIVFCYDNDYRYNKEILNQLKKRIDEGFSVLIYDKRFKWKDMNDAIKGGWSIERLNQYICERTFKSLWAKIEMCR